MSGQAHWISLIPLFLVGAMLVWALLRDRAAARHYRIDQRRFRCPVQKVEVEATLVRDAAQGVVLGVTKCSGLLNQEAVSCSKACVPGFGVRVTGH